MLRELKVWACGVLMLAAVNSVSAFSLLGPLTAEPWQQEVIGYQADGNELFYFLDVGGPMNLAEEYRWNTPILYYAFDAPFLDYFGTNGVGAVEQAIAILNDVTNVSLYSSQLTEFPFDSTRFNFRAAALFLLDMKSQTLSLMLEELGLASSERWTWCLRGREVFTPPPCPGDVDYQVIKRNFDPVTFEPSSYVNGALFSYVIYERCQVIGGIDVLADALEFPVDPLSPSTPVAATAYNSLLRVGNFPGAFYTGLTRDDVGGLRYMWRTNNMNVEGVDPAATLIATTDTTGSFFQVVTTSNLTALTEAAATNNPANLLALYPGLVITSATNSFQVVVSSNFVTFFTNYPTDPPGTPATLITTTVFSTNVEERFSYVFANVITNPFFLNTTNGLIFTNRSAYTNAKVRITETNISVDPYSPPGGPLTTNVTTKTKTRNFINGDFLIIPADACRFEVVSNLITQVIPISTTVTAADGTATNVQGQAFSQTTTYFLTNHVFLVRVTPCPGGTNVPALRQGMEKLTFVRRSYDSLLGQFFEPATTNYNLKAVVGNQLVTETYRRTVNGPDFLFTAADLFNANPGDITSDPWVRPSPAFAAGPLALAGPGIIQAPTTITFNKAGPTYLNNSPFFLDEASQSTFFGWVWSSYDGTTNPPVLYPSGRSIQSLENQVLIQVMPSGLSLPGGTNGVPYNVSLGVIGGQPPYTFSEAGVPPGPSRLPPGLAITNSPSAAIIGIPTAAAAGGTFDFIVRVLDSSARQVDKSYSIAIAP
jgi:hypothetical protein